MFVFFKRLFLSFCFLLAILTSLLQAQNDYKSLSIVGQYGDFSSSAKNVYVGIIYQENPDFRVDSLGSLIDLEYFLYLEEQTLVFDNGRFSLLLSKEDINPASILVSGFLSTASNQRFKASWLSDIDFVYQGAGDSLKLNQNAWLYIVLIDADQVTKESIIDAYSESNGRLPEDSENNVNVKYSAKLASVPYAFSSYVAETLLEVDASDIPDPLQLSNMRLTNFFNVNNFFLLDHLQTKIAVNTNISSFTYDLNGILNVEGLYQNGQNVLDAYFFTSEQGVTLNSNYSRVAIYPDTQNFVFVQEQPFNLHVDGSLLLTGNAEIFVNNDRVLDVLNSQWDINANENIQMIYTTHNQVGILTEPIETLDVNGGIYLSSDYSFDDTNDSVVPGVLAYSEATGFNALLMDEADETQFFSLHRFFGQGQSNKLVYPNDENNLSFSNHLYVNDFGLGLNVTPLALLHLRYQSMDSQSVFLIGQSDNPSSFMNSNGTWFVDQPDDNVFDGLKLSVSTLNASKILMNNVPIRYYFLADYAEDFRLSAPSQDLIDENVFSGSDALFYNAYWDVDTPLDVSKNMYVHIANEIIPTENAADVMPGTVLFLGSMSDFNRFDFPKIRFFNDSLSNKRYFEWRALDTADYITNEDHQFYFELATVDSETNQEDILMRFINSYVGFNTITPSADFSLVGDGFLVQEPAVSVSQLPDYIQTINNPYQMLFIPYSDDLMGQSPSEDKHYFVFLVGQNLLQNIPGDLMSMILMGKSHIGMADMVAAIGGDQHRVMAEHGIAVGGKNIVINGSGSIGLGRNIDVQGDHSFVWSVNESVAINETDHQFMVNTNSFIINPPNGALASSNVQLLMGPRPVYPTDFYNDAFLGALNFVSRNETNVNGGYYDQESLRNMSMFLWAYLVSENIINVAGSVVQPDYFTNNQDLAGSIANILETSNTSDLRNSKVLVDGGLSSDFPAFLQNADFWTTNIIQRWNYTNTSFLFFDSSNPDISNTDFAAQKLTEMLKKLYYHHYFEYKNQNLTDLLRFQHPAILKLGFAADDNYDVIEDNRSLFMIDDSYTLLANVDDNHYQFLENKFGENLPLVSMQVKSDQDAIAIITSNSTYNLQNPTYNFVISKQVPDFFESDQTTDQYRLFVSAKTAANSYVFGQELISLDIFNDLSTYIHGEVSANSLVGFAVESLGVQFWGEVELDNGISAIFPTFNQGLNLIPSRISIHTRDVKSMLSLGDINYRSSPIMSNVRFSTADQNNHHLDFYFDRQSLHFKTTLSDTNFTSVLSLLTSNSVLIGNLTDENWVNQIVSNTQAGDFSLIVNGAAYFGPDYSFFVTQNLNATLQNSSQLDLNLLDVKEIKLVTFNPTFRTQIFSLAGQGWDYLADNNESIVRNGQNGNTLLALLGSDDSSNDTDELTFLRAQNFFNNTGVYVAGTVSVNQQLEAFSLTLSDQIGLTVNSIQINDNDGTPYTLSISEQNGNYSLKLEGNGNERFIGVLSERVSLLNNQITNPLSFLENGDKTRIDAIFYEENFSDRDSSGPLWVLNESNGNFEFQNIFENAQNTATLNIVGGLRVSSQNNLGDIYDIQLANSNLQQSHLIDITVGQYRESESPFIDVSTKIDPPDDSFTENDPVIPVTGLSVEFSSETNQLFDEAGNFFSNYDTFETSTDLYIVGLDIDMSGVVFNTDVTNVGLLAPVMDVFSFVTTGHVLIAKSNQLQDKDIDHVFVNPNESVLAVTGNVYVENNVNIDLLKSNKLLFLNPALTEDPISFLTDETSLNNGQKQIDVRLFAENSVEGYDLAIEGNSKFLAQLIVSNNMDVDSLLFGESSQDSIFQVNTDVVNLYVDAASTLFLEKEESGRNLNHRLQAVDVFSGDNLDQNITLYDFTLRSTPQFPVGEFSDLTAINIDMLGFKLGNNDEAPKSLVGVTVNIAEGDNHIAARFLGGDVLVNHDLETFVFSPDMSLNGDDVYVNGTIKSNQVIGTEIIKDYLVQNVTINNILDASLLSANQLITDQLLSVTVNFLDADVGFLNVANINFDSSQYVTINASNTLFNVYEIATHNTGFPDLISPGSSDIVQAFQFNAHNNADQAVVFGKQDGEGIFGFLPSSELLVNNAVFNSLVASSNTQFRVLSSQQFLFQRLNSSFKFSDRGYLYAFLPEESTEVVPFFLGSDTQGNYIVNDVSSWQTIVLETQSEEHGDDSVGLVFNNDDLQQAAIIHTSSNFQFVLNNDTPLLISKNASVKIGYQTGDMLEDSLNVTDNMLVDTLLFAENGFGRFLKSGPVQVSSNVEFLNNVSNLIQNLDVDVSNQGTYVAHAMHLELENPENPNSIPQDVYLSKLKIITGNLLHGLDANVLGLSVDLQSNSILDFTGLSINVLESANTYAAVFNGAGVGIGNVSPNAALDISGNFYLSGNFSIKDEAENFLQSNRFDSLDISYMGVTVNRLDASWDNNERGRPLSDLTLTGITLNISNHLASADNDLSLRVISSLNMQGVAGVSVNAVSTLASFNSTFVANAVPNLSADRLYVNQRLLFNNLTQESALVYVQEQISQNMWQLLTQNISQQRLFDIGHRPNIISTDADGNPGPIASQLNAQQKAFYLLNRLNTKIPEYAGSHHENWEGAKENFENVINGTYEVLGLLQEIHHGISNYDATQIRVVELNNHINNLLAGIATVSNNFISEDLEGNTNANYAFNEFGVNSAIKFYPSTFIPSYIKYSFLWYQFYILRDFQGRFTYSSNGDVVSLNYPSNITQTNEVNVVDNLVDTFFENYGSIKGSFETLDISADQPDVYQGVSNINPAHLYFMLAHQTTFFTEYMYTILNYFNNNNISLNDIIQNTINEAGDFEQEPFDVIHFSGETFNLYRNGYENQTNTNPVNVNISSDDLDNLFRPESSFTSQITTFQNINNSPPGHRMPDAYHTIIQGQDSLTKNIGGVEVELNPHRFNETEHIVYDFVDFAFLVENYTVNVYRSLKRIQDILQYHVAPTMIITGNMLLGGDQTASIVSVDQYILENVTVTSYKNSTFDFTDAPSLHISVDDAYTSQAVKLPLFAVSEKSNLDNIDPLNMGVVNQNLYFVSTPNNQKHAFLLNHQSNPQAGLTMVDETGVGVVVEMGINYNANVLNEDISDDLSEMSVSINASFQVNSTLTQTPESEDFSVFNMHYHLTSNSLEEASNLSDVNTYAAIKVDLQEITGTAPTNDFDIYGLNVDMSDVSRNETLVLFNYFSDTEFTSTDSVYAAIFKGDVAILPQNVAASFPLRGYHEGYSFQDYFNQDIDVTKNAHLTIYTQNQERIFKVTSNQNTLLNVEQFTGDSATFYAMGLAHSQPTALLTVTPSFYMKAGNETQFLVSSNHDVILTTNLLELGELYVSNLRSTRDIDMQVKVKSVTINGGLFLTENRVQALSTDTYRDNGIMKKGIYANYLYDNPFSLLEPNTESVGFMDVSLKFDPEDTVQQNILRNFTNIFATKVDMSSLILSDVDATSMYSAIFSTTSDLGYNNNEGLDFNQMAVLAKPRVLLTGRKYSKNDLNDIINNKLISSNYVNNNLVIFEDDNVNGAVSFFLPKAIRLKSVNGVNRQINQSNFITQFASQGTGNQDDFVVANFNSYYQFHSSFYNKVGMYLPSSEFRGLDGNILTKLNTLLGLDSNALSDLTNDLYDFYQLRIDFTNSYFYFDLDKYHFTSSGPTSDEHPSFPILSMSHQNNKPFLYFNHPNLDPNINGPYHLFFPNDSQDKALALLGMSSFKFLPSSNVSSISSHYSLGFEEDTFTVNLAVNSEDSNHAFQIGSSSADFYFKALYVNETGSSNDKARINIYNVDSTFENIDYGLLQVVNNAANEYTAVFDNTTPETSVVGMAVILQESQLSDIDGVEPNEYNYPDVEEPFEASFFDFQIPNDETDSSSYTTIGSFKPRLVVTTNEEEQTSIFAGFFESANADYAEFLPKVNPDENIQAADVVGLYQGSVTLDTRGADKLMVISNISIVVGNAQPDSLRHLYEQVAFLGQVPVKVHGSASYGQWLIPSGLSDGHAVAVDPSLMWMDQVVGQVINTKKETMPNQVWALVGFDISQDYFYQHIQTLRDEINKTKDQLNRLQQNYALFLSQQQELEQLLQDKGL